MKIGLDQFPVRHLSDEDKAVIEEACRTGLLPDGRGASQNRLALYLGFSRQAIVNHLKGRQLPRNAEAMSAGAKNAAYVRAMRRAKTMQQSAKTRTIRTVRTVNHEAGQWGPFSDANAKTVMRQGVSSLDAQVNEGKLYARGLLGKKFLPDDN